MDAKAQAEGEKRVKEILIDPLLMKGLAKPATLTKDLFEAMQRDIAARLAYMSADNLAALEEMSATRVAQAKKERFPIANDIFAWARTIQAPPDDASPLIRAVFAAPLGQGAISDGWAPELLRSLRAHRVWPQPYAVSQLKEAGEGAHRRLTRCEDALARGHTLSEEEAQFRAKRLAMVDKCKRIAALSGGSE